MPGTRRFSFFALEKSYDINHDAPGGFRHTYAEAKRKELYEFTHDGKIFVTNFAGFLIEFLEYRCYPEDRVLEFDGSHNTTSAKHGN